MKKLLPCLLAASAVAASAQELTASEDMFSVDDFAFVDHAFPFEFGQVQGKPFSVEQTTESTRNLSDGNRILTYKRVRIVRDHEGRVRREVTVREGGQEKTTVSLSDPVAHASYKLDAASKTARKTPAWPQFQMKLAKLNDQLAKHADRMQELNRRLAEIKIPEIHVTVPAIADVPMELNLVEPRDLGPGVHAKGFSTTHEDLGEEKVEGVMAHGTRDTTRIPAGAIGNEKPILITSERWFAPELGLEVKAFRSDPRYGETKVNVGHVSLAEPDPALLRVPADYRVLTQDGLGGPPLPQPDKAKTH